MNAGPFPAPRRVDLAGTNGSSAVLGSEVDASLPPQGYRLRITPEGSLIDHADDLGLRYARDTLEQLDASGPVGTGLIEDWPTFTERAYMLDISRDRVPTMETLRWLISILGRLRFTELQLYTEHTFAWPEHEVVWRDASPITPDELATLSAWCAESGLRLVPCLNGFGHMERFLRHEAYRARAECPEGAPSLFGGEPSPPTTLAPTPENADFAIDLFRSYLDALPSERIHIGGDEPFELGLCRSGDQVERDGRAAVYARHLRRLIEPLTADGLEVMFWGDVLSHAPEQVATLPKGTTAVAWWYAPPADDPPPMSSLLGPDLVARLGMPEDALAGFATHTRAYTEVDIPFWVAPGTSSWNSLVGRWPDAVENIDDAVVVGADRGARGVLLTDWGDGGHHQPLSVSLPAIVHDAGATWCRDAHDARVVPEVIDALLGADGAGRALMTLGEVDRRLGVPQMNAGAAHNALFGSLFARGDGPEDPSVFSWADDVLTRAAGVASVEGLDPRIVTETETAARLARNGVWRLARALGRPAPPSDVADEDLRECIERHREAWLLSSRPGGLADSLARLQERLP